MRALCRHEDDRGYYRGGIVECGGGLEDMVMCEGQLNKNEMREALTISFSPKLVLFNDFKKVSLICFFALQTVTNFLFTFLGISEQNEAIKGGCLEVYI